MLPRIFISNAHCIGILLVSKYLALVGEGMPLERAVFEGSLARVNPILVTALTAPLALLPLAMGGGERGRRSRHQWRSWCSGGVLTSTMLNMVVVCERTEEIRW